MAARPTHDLCIKTGEYPDRNTGQNKARWLRIGTMFRHEDGGTSIKLECVPAGLPAWNGWINLFEREERQQSNGYHHGQGGSTPQPHRSGGGLDDDIPF